MCMIDAEDVVCDYTGQHKSLTYHNMPVGDDDTYHCEQTPNAVEVFFDGHVVFVEKTHLYRDCSDVSYHCIWTFSHVTYPLNKTLIASDIYSQQSNVVASPTGILWIGTVTLIKKKNTHFPALPVHGC